MAFNGFVRKTWEDRVSEFPLRRRLTDTTSGVSQQVTVARDEGTVTTQGDTFDAANMNGLEARIASSFTEDEAAIGDLTQLATTNKNDLVAAINEVEASVPTFVPESLGDLDNVQLSTSGIVDGSVLAFDGNDSKWKNLQLPAEKVVYTPSQAMPSGYTNPQQAIDYLGDELETLKTALEYAQEFQVGDTFTFTNGLFVGNLAGSSKDIYIFVPTPKKTTNVNVNMITMTGSWYIRGAGVNVVTNQALASVGTVSFQKAEYGIQIKCTLTTASSAANNSVLGALAYSNCKFTFG